MNSANKYALLFVALLILSCKSEKKEQPQQTNESITEVDKLSESVRHHEWIDLKRFDGSVCKAFVVYPESSEPAKSVIVIHENRGLNDWAREFADELASHGYLVIAPDLISNTVEGIEKTTDFENTDEAREAIYALEQDNVTADLNATFNYIKSDKASNGKVSVVGFCWGGSQTFRYAANNNSIEEALVFYGTGPKEEEAYSNIECNVYGFYGGNDNRVNSTIPDSEKYMKKYRRRFEPVIYPDAGHAFMRRGSQSDSDEANKAAHDASWKRLLEILNDG
ncbi:MAG: dienelactone hydrolase family protein [Flavobacteriaceae bacterium]|nr:dienelactone hydrolase family protein [Flavobacteriaceae bacterium]